MGRYEQHVARMLVAEPIFEQFFHFSREMKREGVSRRPAYVSGHLLFGEKRLVIYPWRLKKSLVTKNI